MTTSSYQIREAIPDDAPHWAALRGALWPPPRAEHQREVERYFSVPDPRVVTFVAVSADGRLVGFLELGWRNYAEGCDTSPVAYIEGWYVDASARRRGVGRALVLAAETWALRAGYREIGSDTELDNGTSIGAHASLGYDRTAPTVSFRKTLHHGASIRPAHRDDADAIARIYVRTLRDAYAGEMPAGYVPPMSEPERAARLRRMIVTGERTFLVVESAGRLVGCCTLVAGRDADLPPDTGEIAAIYVDPAHSRRGHGRRLLGAAREEARTRGWRVLVLWVVRSNAAARAFYAGAGLEPDGAEKVDDQLGFSVREVRYRTLVDAG